MKTAHTPGQWQIDAGEGKFKLVDANLEHITYLCESRYIDGREDDEALANARHIVQCVNAHDDLVAALEKIIGVLEYQPDAPNGAAQYAIGAARAALAKVQS